MVNFVNRLALHGFALLLIVCHGWLNRCQVFGCFALSIIRLYRTNWLITSRLVCDFRIVALFTLLSGAFEYVSTMTGIVCTKWPRGNYRGDWMGPVSPLFYLGCFLVLNILYYRIGLDSPDITLLFGGIHFATVFDWDFTRVRPSLTNLCFVVS